MEFKYLLFRSRIDLFGVKDFSRETFLGGEHMTSSSTETA